MGFNSAFKGLKRTHNTCNLSQAVLHTTSSAVLLKQSLLFDSRHKLSVHV